MKKKVLFFMLVVVFVLSLGAASVFASQEPYGFIDQNNDGICDNLGVGATCSQDGIGRQAGQQYGVQGDAFTDENNDGICDSRDTVAACPQDGTGQQNRCRNGR